MIFMLLFYILGISVASYQIMYVQILALTTTSTAEIFKAVKRLSLAVNGVSLNRTNIKYYVEPLPLINTLCDLIAKNLSSLRLLFPKTLIFCQTIAECSLMYETIINNTEGGFTEPPGSPDYHKFRLIDMYCRSSLDAMKKKVLKSYMTPGGKLRIVIATTAFSMGIGCPDICNIIHYSPKYRPVCPENRQSRS